ncbi:hypothetical protein QJQ45_003041 [Haematococcus lacustris]|nr:hypothetical protein QJQ45_003041 [Haematococcus lacustris]
MEAYTVVKRLGVGTYGSAYLITTKHDPGQQLVLKKVQQAQLVQQDRGAVKIDEDNEKETQQAMLEVAVLAQLNHPLVLRYAAPALGP